MPHASIANDPAPHPQPEVLFYAIWAVGRPGSGWEHFPSFVGALNPAFMEVAPADADELRGHMEHAFTAFSDSDDAIFWVEEMTCSLPTLPVSDDQAQQAA